MAKAKSREHPSRTLKTRKFPNGDTLSYSKMSSGKIVGLHTWKTGFQSLVFSNPGHYNNWKP